jgi:hypothetical protein
VIDEYAERTSELGREESLLWGRSRVPRPENALDKQIAATALINDLTLVTRNTGNFVGTGVKLLNPFLRRGKGGEQGPRMAPKSEPGP